MLPNLIPLASAAEASDTAQSSKEATTPEGNFIYLTNEQSEKINTSLGRVGIRLGAEKAKFVILEIEKESSAGRAKLMPGDEVLAIDGQALSGSTLKAAMQKLRGRPDSMVRLTVLQAGAMKPSNVTLIRQSSAAFKAQEDKDVAVRSWPMSQLGKSCPKEHAGCHLIFAIDPDCHYSCRKGQK